MHHRLLVGLCAGAFTVAFASCDSGEDRLSQEEFEEQANEICSEGNEEIEAIFEEAFPADGEEPSSEEIAEVFTDEFLPNVRGQIEDLRSLSPPEDVEEDLDAALDDAEEALDEAEERIEEDAEAFVTSEEDLFADVNEQLEELGLDECAEG